jgi:Skp family chaperone for outer membrane proteins
MFKIMAHCGRSDFVKHIYQSLTRRWLILTLCFIVVGVSGLILEGQAQSDGVIKMGFVRVDDVFVKFEGTNDAIEAFRQERIQVEAQLADLQDDLDNEEISTAEFLVLRSQLLAQLSAVETQFSAAITAQIVNATRQLGEKLAFDLITPINNVVVHAQSRVVSDLTDAVLQIMNADFEGIPFDFNSISVSPQPLETIGFFNAERVFSNYKGTNDGISEISADLNEIEAQRQQVTRDRDEGVISQAEFLRRQSELNGEQAEIEQAFVDDIIGQIIEVVGEVGDEVGFDLLSSRNNVILHSDSNSVANITNSVIDLMNARYDGESFDVDQISLPGGAPRKLGFINADRVFVEFVGTDEAITEFRVQIEAAQEELAQLQEDLDEGRISPLDAFNRQEALEAELNQLDNQLSGQITDLISANAESFGEEQGYDLITPLANVILYHNPDLIDDLTDEVIALMNDQN